MEIGIILQGVGIVMVSLFSKQIYITAQPSILGRIWRRIIRILHRKFLSEL